MCSPGGHHKPALSERWAGCPFLSPQRLPQQIVSGLVAEGEEQSGKPTGLLPLPPPPRALGAAPWGVTGAPGLRWGGKGDGLSHPAQGLLCRTKEVFPQLLICHFMVATRTEVPAPPQGIDHSWAGWGWGRSPLPQLSTLKSEPAPPSLPSPGQLTAFRVKYRPLPHEPPAD